MRELKYIDSSNSNTYSLAGTGTLSLVNGVQQGSDAITRIGRKIVMKSIYVRGRVNIAPTTTGTSALRTMLIYDKQANASTPAVTDILLQDAMTSPMNLNNRDRFLTLYDHVDPCIGTAGPQATAFQTFKRGNWMVQFNQGSAGTVGDIQTGSLYLLTYTSGGFGVAAPSAVVEVRVRFDDT